MGVPRHIIHLAMEVLRQPLLQMGRRFADFGIGDTDGGKSQNLPQCFDAAGQC
ncbi:MAG: hypothetical protein BWY57_03166 [Betaproteobacteria bacterium ADurb.Bin341]|nr:MAG: hypothetical protein BWY57_03166 [Betaproteobacteria bacterium ADurb.Bin341]